MSAIKESLHQTLYQTWLELAKKHGWDPKLINQDQFLVEYPDNEIFGDLSSNILLILIPKLRNVSKGIVVDQISQEFSQILTKHLPSFIDKVANKNNFLNFTIKNSYFLEEMEKILQTGKAYGQTPVLKGKKIIVEYAHPNTHKAFHLGHLRNITNGETVVRILEALGAQVIRVNYQGDVGLHIAKCLWALSKDPVFTSKKITGGNVKTGSLQLKEKIEFLGKAYTFGNQAYETDKQAKQEILAINKKIYNQSDSQITKLWQETRKWSLDYFESIYKRVGTHFDRYYFESEVAAPGKKIVLAAMKKGIFTKSKGAIIFSGSKYGLHDRVFITAEGNPTYEAKDMELARLQFSEHHPDLIIHNVGPEQAGYFQVIFKALAQVFPQIKGKEYHLKYGWVRLKQGKMSSRTGQVVLAEWLLDEAKNRLKQSFPEIDEATAEQIGVGAVKYSFLKVAPQTEVVFDFDESISLEGNSGPYLQYTYARCQSVIAKAKKNYELRIMNYELIKNLELNHEEMAVLRWLYRYPEVVFLAGQTYSPNLIANYLYDLAQRFNVFYNKNRILGDKNIPPLTTNFRLSLTQATSQILQNGLYLLGIKTPIKM